MAIKLFVLVCWGWISAWNLVCSAASDPINKTAKPGDNITLSCRAPSSTNIIVVEWNRPDLEPQYVFMYRDGQSDPDNQHESFKDRVELEDSEMKDGDVSLVLRNVNINDRGTYECRVVLKQTTHIDPISIVHLSVRQPGSTGGQTVEEGDEDGGDEDGGNTEKSIKNEEKFGHVGLAVGLSVFGVLFIVCLIVMFRKTVTFTKRLKPRYQPPPKAEVSAAS